MVGLTSKENTVEIAFFAHREHARERATAGQPEDGVLNEQNLTTNILVVRRKLFQSRENIESFLLLTA